MTIEHLLIILTLFHLLIIGISQAVGTQAIVYCTVNLRILRSIVNKLRIFRKLQGFDMLIQIVINYCTPCIRVIINLGLHSLIRFAAGFFPLLILMLQIWDLLLLISINK